MNACHLSGSFMYFQKRAITVLGVSLDKLLQNHNISNLVFTFPSSNLIKCI